MKKKFKEEESSEILKIVGLIDNIEKFQININSFKDKCDWRKHTSRI